MNEIKKVAAMTLGCKVNMYDTEAILKLFAEKGYMLVDFEDAADVYIINTCTVTNLSDKKSRQMIRRARKLNNEAIIVATGCYAQVSPDEVSKIEDINIITGTGDRAGIVDIVENYNDKATSVISITDVTGKALYEDLEISDSQNRTRAYMKIQDGCNQFCAYCIIPYARGTIRSRRPADVLNEANRLAANGYKEIVLAGIHVASYGKDLTDDTDLCDLLHAVHGTKGIERIRLSSLEPGFITDKFIGTITGLTKVCNHFHLSLQSGCNKTLHVMNRKYTKEEYRQAVQRLRETLPDVAVTTDMIVGFPGETDEDFLESYEFAAEMKFAKIHVFPYSPKKGTSAAGMRGEVSTGDKNIRAGKLLELCNKMSMDFLSSHIGRIMPVLMEEKIDENTFLGHTSNYIKVNVKSDCDIINQISEIEILNVDYNMAFGKKMSEIHLQ